MCARTKFPTNSFSPDEEDDFVTIGSAMNEEQEDTDAFAAARIPTAYPDFFEDANAMNRYLW